MNVLTNVEIDVRDMISHLTWDESLELILDVDLAVADVTFTMDVVKKLLESLEKDASGPLCAQAYTNVITALDEFYQIGYV